jgi:hypothetical protein
MPFSFTLTHQTRTKREHATRRIVTLTIIVACLFAYTTLNTTTANAAEAGSVPCLAESVSQADVVGEIAPRFSLSDTLGTDCAAGRPWTFPLGAYQLKSSGSPELTDPGSWFGSAAQGFSAFLWEINKYTAYLGIMLLGWSQSLPAFFVDTKDGPFYEIFKSIKGSFDALKILLPIMMLVMAAWVAWKGIIQGRTGEALGSIISSVLLFIGCAVIIANPIGTIGLVSNGIDNVGGVVLQSTTYGSSGQKPTDTIGKQIFQTEISRPWAFLQFGMLTLPKDAKPGAGCNAKPWVATDASFCKYGRGLLSAPSQQLARITMDAIAAGELPDTNQYVTVATSRGAPGARGGNGGGTPVPTSATDLQVKQTAAAVRYSNALKTIMPLTSADTSAAILSNVDQGFLRVGLSFLMLLTTLGQSILILALTATILMSKVMVIVQLAFLPLVAIASFLPGVGHRFAVGALKSILKTLLVQLGAVVLLAITAMIIDALQTAGGASGSGGAMGGFLLSAIFAWVIVIKRNDLAKMLGANNPGDLSLKTIRSQAQGTLAPLRQTAAVAAAAYTGGASAAMMAATTASKGRSRDIDDADTTPNMDRNPIMSSTPTTTNTQPGSSTISPSIEQSDHPGTEWADLQNTPLPEDPETDRYSNTNDHDVTPTLAGTPQDSSHTSTPNTNETRPQSTIGSPQNTPNSDSSRPQSVAPMIHTQGEGKGKTRTTRPVWYALQRERDIKEDINTPASVTRQRMDSHHLENLSNKSMDAIDTQISKSEAKGGITAAFEEATRMYETNADARIEDVSRHVGAKYGITGQKMRDEIAHSGKLTMISRNEQNDNPAPARNGMSNQEKVRAATDVFTDYRGPE